MKQRLRRLVLAGLAGLPLAFLLPLTTNVASAKYCPNGGSYCIYEPYGQSGTGASGTGSLMGIPTSVTLYHNDEEVVGSVFLYNNFSSAIETGIGYGWDNVCGYNPYWTPYGTINNGGTEQNDCGYHLAANTTWQVQAFVTNRTGFSFFNDQYGDPKWTVNWGTYNITGLNYDQSEIHGDGDQPQYGGEMGFINEQWWNGSSWSYWGYTNVTSDCPYVAQWVDNSYWYSYDEIHC